jgi:DNA-binding NtrC family response regulator
MGWLLVVEHDRSYREGLTLLLEWRTGLSSIYAGSLAEAKGVLAEETRKPACIIVDLDLPDGGGPELLEDLDRVPVLALVKDRSLKRQSEAMGLGAEEVLRTGSVEKITATVERLIGR